jgi:hypothetical protein
VRPLSELLVEIPEDLPDSQDHSYSRFEASHRQRRSIVKGSPPLASCAMELITILNRCYRFRGFVYQHAHFSADKKSIEVAVRPRKGSIAVCSRCHHPARGYDQLAERRFEFIPLWGFFLFLLYAMRRVDCRRCGAVVVEEVPWGDGKRTLTKAYMLFLARWARRLSWKETAEAFRTSWDKVFDAVEHVVTWGLDHRTLGEIDAIGVDEIQYAKGHKYLTLVYQIDIGVTRLLWVGKERTIESFQGFFTTMGQEVSPRSASSAQTCGNLTSSSSAKDALRLCISSTASTSSPI